MDLERVRLLHARLYVTANARVFAAPLAPSYSALAKGMAHVDVVPTLAEAPSPAQLGLCDSVAELCESDLSEFHTALISWQARLDSDDSKKSARMILERREIDQLRRRLHSLRAWLGHIKRGNEPIGAPFFLDSLGEADLAAILGDSQVNASLPKLFAWHARVIYWLSGACATKRYLSAITRSLDEHPRVICAAELRLLEQFIARAFVLQRRQPIGREIATFIRQIRRLSPESIETIRNRRQDRLVGLHRVLVEALRLEPFRDYCDAAARVAALVACDRSDAPIPRICFQIDSTTGEMQSANWATRLLASQLGKAGYNTLLSAYDEIPREANGYQTSAIRALLVRGASMSEVHWAFDKDILMIVVDSSLAIREIRRLFEAIEACGIPTDSCDHGIASLLQGANDLAAVYNWIAWVQSVSKRTITPRLAKLLVNSLLDTYLPLASKGRLDHVRPLVAPLEKAENGDRLSAMLDRIRDCRGVALKRSDLPKSLRKLMNPQTPRAHEGNRPTYHLSVVASEHKASSQWYEGSVAEATLHPKLIRRVEKLFLMSGMEALEAQSQDMADANCRGELREIAESFSPRKTRDADCWLGSMSAGDRLVVQELLAYRASHGDDYKRALPGNQLWIARARRRGVDLGPWLHAEPRTDQLEGRTVRIELASNLRDLFLMGEYFGTCLSFSGVNSDSVLSNAYDADKQVVFMFSTDEESKRIVVARMLIAINSKYQLLRYQCYAHERTDDPRRQAYLAAISTFCGRLAADCCLALADKGMPENLGTGSYWYDDDAVAWDDDAKKAWANRREEIESQELAANKPHDELAPASTCGDLHQCLIR